MCIEVSVLHQCRFLIHSVVARFFLANPVYKNVPVIGNETISGQQQGGAGRCQCGCV